MDDPGPTPIVLRLPPVSLPHAMISLGFAILLTVAAVACLADRFWRNPVEAVVMSLFLCGIAILQVRAASVFGAAYECTAFPAEANDYRSVRWRVRIARRLLGFPCGVRQLPMEAEHLRVISSGNAAVLVCDVGGVEMRLAGPFALAARRSLLDFLHRWVPRERFLE